MPSGELDFPEIAVVYARFAALTALSPNLGGHLLLYAGLDRNGIATAIAANVAGATSLGIEPDAARAKQALRAGVCDFVVNNLDEALRILKNEIRKKRAVSVVVTAEQNAAVAEIVERGVQPEVLAFRVRELEERGAKVLSVPAKNAENAMTWSAKGKWLTAMDELAVTSLKERGSEPDPRVRWIEASPRYLGRAFAGQRYLRMTDVEADAFVAAVRAAVRTGAIPAEVSVARNGEAVSIMS